jgi:hypothetical protein
MDKWEPESTELALRPLRHYASQDMGVRGSIIGNSAPAWANSQRSKTSGTTTSIIFHPVVAVFAVAVFLTGVGISIVGFIEYDDFFLFGPRGWFFLLPGLVALCGSWQYALCYTTSVHPGSWMSRATYSGPMTCCNFLLFVTGIVLVSIPWAYSIAASSYTVGAVAIFFALFHCCARKATM